MALQNTPNLAEIERANRMFAIEQATKITYTGETPEPVEHARAFFEFLQENPLIQRQPTGFQIEEQ